MKKHYNRDWYRNRRQKRIAAGECPRCGKKRRRVDAYYNCTKCRKANADERRPKNAGMRQRYRDEGRCVVCSVLLFPEADAGFRSCVNCRTGHMKPRGVTLAVTIKETAV